MRSRETMKSVARAFDPAEGLKTRRSDHHNSVLMLEAELMRDLQGSKCGSLSYESEAADYHADASSRCGAVVVW